MDVAFTKRFLDDVKKLKKDLRTELERAIEKILENPHAGKPLKYSFKGCRSIRVGKLSPHLILQVEVEVLRR